MVWLETIHAPTGMPVTGTASSPSWPTLAVLTLTLTVPVEVAGRIRWGLTTEGQATQLDDGDAGQDDGHGGQGAPDEHADGDAQGERERDVTDRGKAARVEYQR